MHILSAIQAGFELLRFLAEAAHERLAVKHVKFHVEHAIIIYDNRNF